MQVRLENIHVREIQQGNEKETLALIWAIILRYQSEYIDISYLVSFCLYNRWMIFSLPEGYTRKIWLMIPILCSSSYSPVHYYTKVQILYIHSCV